MPHEDINILYSIRKSLRARRMRISVSLEGNVVVTVPGSMADQRRTWISASGSEEHVREIAEKFLRQKWDWVKSTLTKFSVYREQREAWPEWRKRTYTRKDYLVHKEEARAMVDERLKYFADLYRLRLDATLPSWDRVSIRNQSSRWGSCSRLNSGRKGEPRRNLNFNYKILFLPQSLRDYVIVHELCHLREMNHSKKFWELVALAVPDYKELRREMR